MGPQSAFQAAWLLLQNVLGSFYTLNFEEHGPSGQLPETVQDPKIRRPL